MARKKKHAEHVNHERWLVSYADFITLLFAFFVVMFAVSQVDSKKVGRFTESFSKAVGVDIFPQPGKGIMPGVSNGVPSSEDDASKTSALPAELDGLQASISESGGKESAIPGIQMIARRHELVLRLADGLLFDSGNDTLREPAVRVLQRLAVELKKRSVDVRVEGHTDNRPIRNSRFRSNWDLSTSRATAVVARLAAEGLPAARLSAAGYGEFHPIAPNATDDGMKKNRRVDLIVSITNKPAIEVTLKEAAPEKNEKSDKAAKEGAKGGEGAKDESAKDDKPVKESADDEKTVKEPSSEKPAVKEPPPEKPAENVHEKLSLNASPEKPSHEAAEKSAPEAHEK